MVAATLIRDENAIRWLGYLIVSSCLILVLGTSLEVSKPKKIMDVSHILKISFHTQATPKPVVEKQTFTHPTIPAPQAEPKVVTQKQAVKKIAQQKITNDLKVNRSKAEIKNDFPYPQKKPVAPVKIKEKRSERSPLTEPVIQKRVESNQKRVAPIDKGTSATTVIKNARYRKQTPPVYPKRSLELGQQGIVTIHAEILPNGKPKTMKVVKSSGYRRLDMAALSAVKKWEFETGPQSPGTSTWVRVPVRFIIK